MFFGLNKLVDYAAANISIAPLAPLLAFVSAQLGTRLLYGRWLSFSVSEFRARPLRALAHEFFVTWLAGGVVLGAAIGLVGGTVVYLALIRRRKADAIDAAIARATERYRGLHPRLYWYARMKYKMDPVYRSIAAEVPANARVLDLGAGLGMLATLLTELSPERRATSVEWDEEKVRAAEHAARGDARLSVRRGDVTALDPQTLPEADVVTIVDVLHYFDDATIARVLDAALARLAPSGTLLIREGDRAKSGGSSWTRFVEWLAVKIGWNRAHAVDFRDAGALKALLEARGLTVSVQDTAGKLHPGNVLFVCRRR